MCSCVEDEAEDDDVLDDMGSTTKALVDCVTRTRHTARRLEFSHEVVRAIFSAFLLDSFTFYGGTVEY